MNAIFENGLIVQKKNLRFKLLFNLVSAHSCTVFGVKSNFCLKQNKMQDTLPAYVDKTKNIFEMFYTLFVKILLIFLIFFAKFLNKTNVVSIKKNKIAQVVAYNKKWSNMY